MNFSFTSFLFTLSISHFFISLFLVFSLPFIFSLILAFTKELSECISALHIHLISHTFVHCLLSTNMWSIWLHILLSDDLQVTLWMSVRWHHVPVVDKSLSRTKFIIPFLLSSVTFYRLCPQHTGYKQHSFPALALKSPSTVFMSWLRTASHTFSKELQNSSLTTSSFSSFGAYVDH